MLQLVTVLQVYTLLMLQILIMLQAYATVVADVKLVTQVSAIDVANVTLVIQVSAIDVADVTLVTQVSATDVAGQTLSRCILSSCWEVILDVLSVLLDGKSSCGITFSLGLLLGTEGAREETQRGRDAICLSLSGLQTASRLCCMLGELEQPCCVQLGWCLTDFVIMAGGLHGELEQPCHGAARLMPYRLYYNGMVCVCGRAGWEGGPACFLN